MGSGSWWMGKSSALVSIGTHSPVLLDTQRAPVYQCIQCGDRHASRTSPRTLARQQRPGLGLRHMPMMPLHEEAKVTVQLVNRDGNVCWGIHIHDTREHEHG